MLKRVLNITGQQFGSKWASWRVVCLCSGIKFFQHLIVWQSQHETTVPINVLIRGNERHWGRNDVLISIYVKSHVFWGINTICLPDSLLAFAKVTRCDCYVSYETHNYNSVGREICAKTAVCFDQFNLPPLKNGKNLLKWLKSFYEATDLVAVM